MSDGDVEEAPSVTPHRQYICFRVLSHTHDIVKSGGKKLGTKNVDTFGIFGEGDSERIQED